MLKACLRLLAAGGILFVTGIIGLAALELNGYDISDVSLPIGESSSVTDYGYAASEDNYDGAIARYDSDEINKLDIRVNAGDFTVIGGESFCISADGINSEWLKYEVKDKCLSVTFSPEFNFLNFDFLDFDADDANIVITVPQKVLESADFSVSAGDLNVECLEAERISLDITEGAAVFGNVAAAESSQIKMSAGECTFHECVFNNANIKMSAGYMTLSACRIIGGSSVKMSMGSLYMDLIGRRSDYDITVDKTAGHVYIDGIDFGAGEYSFTTFEETGVMIGYEITDSTGGEGVLQVQEAASEKNTIDIKLTAGECNIFFYENQP